MNSARLSRGNHTPLPDSSRRNNSAHAFAHTQSSRSPVAGFASYRRPGSEDSTARSSLRGSFSVGRAHTHTNTHTHTHTGKRGPTKFIDARNISSETFKREAAKTIARYLSTHQYPHPLNPKLLASPTKQTVIDMMQFLIQALEPCVKLLKPEDDIPKFFKDIGYPVTINKTIIMAPGAPNTWPHLLAAMSWLCELLTYEEEVFPNLNVNEVVCEDDDIGAVFYSALTRGYKNFLSAKPGDVDNVDEIIGNSLKSQHEFSQKLFKERHEYLLHLQKQKQDVQLSLTHHGEVQQAINQSENSLKILHTTLKELEDSVKQAETTRASIKQKLEIRQAELKNVEDENTKIENQISTQGINKSEVSRIDADIRRKRQSVQTIRHEREFNNQEYMKMETAIQEKLHELRQLAGICNSAIMNCTQKSQSNKTQSHTALAAYANVSVQPDATSIDDALNFEWKERKIALKELMDKEVAYRKKSVESAAATTGVLEHTESMIRLKQKEMDEMKNSILRLEKQNEQIEKSEQRKIEALKEDIAEAEDFGKQDRGVIEARLKKARENIDILRSQYDQQSREYDHRIREGMKCVVLGGEELADMKDAIATEVSRAANDASDAKQEIEAAF